MTEWVEIGGARLACGDCREILPGMAADSIDACISDPPYELNFMGRSWDRSGVAFDPATWAAVLRVMKPGAYLAAFGGTRGYHRLACAIEDAGFEIRDCVTWHYGSGMPKSHNLRRGDLCACESSGNALSNVHDKTQSEHSLRLLREADLQATEYNETERNQIVQPCLPEQASREFSTAYTGSDSETGRSAAGIEQPGMEGRFVHRTGQGLSDDTGSGPSEDSQKRVCAGAHHHRGKDDWPSAETGRGSSSHQPRSGGQPSGKSQGVCEPSGTLDGGTLRGRGQCPRCGKLKATFEGFGTALKPATELICLARKPLSEKTVAANVLKWGTGAINVDAGRVPVTDAAYAKNCSGDRGHAGNRSRDMDFGMGCGTANATGRWPANLAHDGSPEVMDAFAAFGATKSSGGRIGNAGGGDVQNIPVGRHKKGDPGFGDTGSVARYFYSAKASKADRMNFPHPTIKPVSLMRWLTRMLCPTGGVVLDPFAGTATGAQAAIAEGIRAIAIEEDAQHFEWCLERMRKPQPAKQEALL